MYQFQTTMYKIQATIRQLVPIHEVDNLTPCTYDILAHAALQKACRGVQIGTGPN